MWLGSLTVLRFLCVHVFAYVSFVLYYMCLHVVLFHGQVSLVRLRPVWMTFHPPSVLWHCWLGHQIWKISYPKWPILRRVRRYTLLNSTRRQSIKSSHFQTCLPLALIGCLSHKWVWQFSDAIVMHGYGFTVIWKINFSRKFLLPRLNQWRSQGRGHCSLLHIPPSWLEIFQSIIHCTLKTADFVTISLYLIVQSTLFSGF